MKVWLDDFRTEPDGWMRARTAWEAIALLETGTVEHISLDHDLGPEEAGTGYDVALWMEKEASKGTLPPLTWDLHTANPVGADNMRQALRSAERFWNA